jgi:hypothetical protein
MKQTERRGRKKRNKPDEWECEEGIGESQGNERKIEPRRGGDDLN